MIANEVAKWFSAYEKDHPLEVSTAAFDDLAGWGFSEAKERLVHSSGKFFSIQGVRVEMPGPDSAGWDQPIINQPEVGILGIVTAMIDGTRKYLMQAKVEPGNLPLVQLSPTVQATRSNYTRVHGGSEPPYLQLFLGSADRILVDLLQPEQGARFLAKRNRNMVVETSSIEEPPPGFRWFTLGELKTLLLQDNVVNMDARSVISCIPPCGFDPPHATESSYFDSFHVSLSQSFHQPAFLPSPQNRLMSWLTEAKVQHKFTLSHVPLPQLREWEIGESSIRHREDRYFSVIGIRVSGGSREVLRWCQPIVKPASQGLAGILVSRTTGTLRFLVRATMEPGNSDSVLIGPTVMCGEPLRRMQDPLPPRLLDVFMRAPKESMLYTALQSEEGGRFYQMRNQYMILEEDGADQHAPPPDYAWVTLAELLVLNQFGICSIELRTLLATLDLT